MNETIENQNELTLSDIIAIIRGKILFLVIITLVFGVLLGIYAYGFATPKYKSTGLLIVAVETTQGETNAVESQRLVQTTVTVLNNDNKISILASTKLSENGITLTPIQIRNRFSVSSQTNDLAIKISFVDENKEYAQTALRAYAESFIEIINNPDSIDKTLKDNVRLQTINEAVYDSPNRPLLVVVGLLLGGIIGLVTVFIKEAMNNTFKTKEELENHLGIQVLGMVPEFEGKRGEK